MRPRQIVTLGLCGVFLFWGNSAGLPAVTTLSLDAGGGVQPWDYSTANWLDQYGSPSTWIDGSMAQFMGTAGTVSASGSIASVNTITFASSGYVLSGGTITLTEISGGTGVGGSIVVQNGTATINSILAGTTGIWKAGPGTLVLGAANSFTGDTRIIQGTLRIADANALQYSTLNHIYNGTLSFGTCANTVLGGLKGNKPLTLVNDVSEFVQLTVGGNGESTTYSGSITGTTGSVLRKVGSGTLTFSGTSNCDTMISAGTLQLGTPTALQNSTVQMDGGSLNCGTFTPVILGGLKGNGNLALDSVQLVVGNNNQSTAYNGVLSGSMSLCKVGSGTLTLGAENTFSGDTLISAGTLKLAAANALQNSTLDYQDSPTPGYLRFASPLTSASLGGLKGSTTSLTLLNDAFGGVALSVGGNGQSTTFNGAITGGVGSSLRKVGSGTLTFGGSSNCDTVVSEGALKFGTSTALQNSTVQMDGGSLNTGVFPLVVLGGLKGNGGLALDGVQLVVGSNNQSTTYNGALSGSVSLCKAGSGTLTLGGENAFTGDTLISTGWLTLGTANALRNSTLDYSSSSGWLSFGTLASATFGGLKGNQNMSLYGAEPVALTVGGNNQSTTYSGTMDTPLSSSLRKVGSGTLTIGGYLYCTTILSEGTVALGGANVLQGSTVEMAGGSLNCGAFPSVMLGGLKGTGNLVLNGVQLVVGNNGQSTTYSGVLSGSMLLAKTGSGTLTVGGENTFSGDTLISYGTLTLGTANALQNSTLDYSGSGALSLGSLAAATLGGLKGTKTLGLPPAAVLTVGGNGQSTTFNGSVNGMNGPFDSSLRKAGSGTLTLGGTVYCRTVLGAGTVRLGASGVLAMSAVEADGGSLSCGSFPSVTLGALTGSGNLALDGVSLTIGGNGASTTYSGVLSGSVALTTLGNGTLTLSGANTYTGDTNVGTALTLANVNALQNSTLIPKGTLLSFGTLTSATVGGLRGNTSNPLVLYNASGLPVAVTVGGNGQSTTYTGNITGPTGASLRKVGSGTLTLGGGNACDTIISEGVLQLGTATALQTSTVQMDGGTLSCGAFPIVTIGGLGGSGNLALDGVNLNVGANNKSTVYDGVLSGSVLLGKVGAGTLTLNAENTFTGDTNIVGTLALGNARALQNSTVNYQDWSAAGYLRFGSLTDATLGGLKGNRSLTLVNDSFSPVALSVGNNNQSTTFTGVLSGPGSLRKIGSGTLTLDAANDFLGKAVIESGQLALRPAAYNAAFTLGGVDIRSGKLVFDYTGLSSPAAVILDLLADSYNNGLWDVGQFQSTTASAAGLTLGWLDDDSSKITVMPTYAGDFNLDGAVNDLDRAIIRANIGGPGTWAMGDANYDGQINLLDWNLWKAHLGLALVGGGSGGSSVSAIPEPGSALLLVVGLLGLLTRVRRRRSQGAVSV
jgi:fibronectin-binding autotransporter adhesin